MKNQSEKENQPINSAYSFTFHRAPWQQVIVMSLSQTDCPGVVSLFSGSIFVENCAEISIKSKNPFLNQFRRAAVSQFVILF